MGLTPPHNQAVADRQLRRTTYSAHNGAACTIAQTPAREVGRNSSALAEHSHPHMCQFSCSRQFPETPSCACLALTSAFRRACLDHLVHVRSSPKSHGHHAVVTTAVCCACHHIDNSVAASVATSWLGSSPSQRRHQPHAQLNRYLRKHWCPPLPPIQWQGSSHRAPPHRRDSAVGPIWGPTAPPGHRRPHFVGFIETLKSASDHQTVLTECLAKSRVLAKLVSESSRPRGSSLLRLART